MSSDPHFVAAATRLQRRRLHLERRRRPRPCLLAFRFGIARFAPGIDEEGNFPACIKAVRNWFPGRGRALAAGIFDTGTNVGLITSFLVPCLTVWISCTGRAAWISLRWAAVGRN
jgi:hypothetical protein